MTQNGTKIANLNVATSEKRMNKQTGQREETTEWHRLVVIGSLADVVEKYMRKGSKAYFEGRLQTRKWEKDGQERYTTEILVDNLTMLDGKPESDGRQQGSASARTEAPFNDDIPF
ncbi:single-stranded DNA-binding protein [Jiella pelagia]|uniref:Single-stranded DNA-binding protein n=1 Tax=Jiella pelagia TaxID=2986949 RepID=A0ABY7C202_9HYPH|nr:single-stranded DNA-binding protein [Jiella pelagia]WAP69064.1 single-stranded DNA-binding protein [Jiella pelagia]